jgi:hypothetical protein
MPLEVITILRDYTYSHASAHGLVDVALLCFTPASLLLYSWFISNRAVVLLYLYSCFTPTVLLLCNCCNPVLLKYMLIHARVLLLDCIFVRALQSKTRKRHLAASAAPLHEEAGVCVLIRVGVEQASTRL